MTYRLIALLILLVLTFGALGVTPVYADASIVVNTDVDEDIANANCSLREAIIAANTNLNYRGCTGTGAYGADTITFNGDYTITLASTLTIDKSLTIDGAGHKITISGDKDKNDGANPGDVRVFYINSGISANLNNLTVTNGYAADQGAGIVNLGTLNVTNSTLSNNLLQHDGSGGAGIYNSDTGTLNVTNSTFSGNNADNASGGAILNNGTLTVINSTFSGNIASSGGGGGVRNNGTAMLKNTILANSTGDNCSKNDIGSITDGGGNLEDGVTCGFSAVTSRSSTNPKLGALDYYGGLTKTFPLQPGSAAIDAGVSATCAAAPVSGLDQRGVTRPSGKCDIGAYEIGIYYVKPAASGAGNCLSWANACTLQTALTTAQSGDEIWVAAGVYKPGTLRTDTFQLKSGVAVYGGFAGVDAETLRTDRNPSEHVSILSGDIDNNDSQTPITNLTTVTGNTTNAYHVATGASDATLDGFTITAGYASGTNSDPCEQRCGGGMYNFNVSNLRLITVAFRGNSADHGGGGVFDHDSSFTMTDVTFNSNKAVGSGGGLAIIDGATSALKNVTFSGNETTLGDGGGLYNWGKEITLTNVTFSDNQAMGNGGGMNTQSYKSTLTNATFSGNSATGNGDGVYYSGAGHPTIQNVILWGATPSSGGAQIYIDPTTPSTLAVSNSIVQGGYAGATDPLSGPLLGKLGDYGGPTQTIPLLPGSPAIDTGDAAACPLTDQRGQARLGTCDIGAYEYTGDGGGGGGGVIVHPWVIIASDGLYPERVRVDWTASTGASYYLVYRSESLDGPKLPTEGVRTTSPGGDDLWALPGVTYYYWVRACTDSGCGEFYTYNYDTGWRGLAAPLITASDGLFSDKVQVSWPAVPGASSYLGYRAESLAGTQIPVNGYLTTFPGGDDLWALPGVTYFYWVKACNGLNCSALSVADTGWR